LEEACVDPLKSWFVRVWFVTVKSEDMSIELRIENLSKTYQNGVKALDNVSLTIPARGIGAGVG